MALLYADENFPIPVVEELRRLGHDVLTIFQDGKGNQQYPDVAVLQDASSYGRAILTLNRKHFRRLHEKNAVHAGMILCTYDSDFLGQAQRIHMAIATQETLSKSAIYVNRPSKVANS
jgi:predicted nuclease of predicted toxin-antitoxin system